MSEGITAAKALLSDGGVLKAMYSDLAAPGVRQVGRALETVLSLGNNLLIPLRLLNCTAVAYERRKFEEIADRFSSIADEDVINVAPEIGVPIMDKLSVTTDSSLRAMFVELLAKSADRSQVMKAHPSFVSVISALSPDEAIMVSALKGQPNIPAISIIAESLERQERITMVDLVIEPLGELTFPDNSLLYINNLTRLGILEVIRNTYLTRECAYDGCEAYIHRRYNLDETIVFGDLIYKRVYNRESIEILKFGQSFIEACT